MKESLTALRQRILQRQRHIVVQLGIAAALTVAAFTLTLVLWPFLQPHPFLFFFAAVCLSAYRGGWIAGVTSGVASAAIADYFFISPWHTFSWAFRSVVAGTIFVLVSLLISSLSERQRATAHKLEAVNAELGQRLDKFQTLFRVIPIGIAYTDDPSCGWIYPNPAFARLLGVPEVENISLSAPEEQRPSYRVFRNDTEIPADQLPMQVAIQQGREVRDWDCEVLLADGSWLALLGFAAPLINESGRAQGAVCASLDLTDRTRMEEALRRTEQLVSAGMMAAALAHEVNNPLAALTNILYLIHSNSHLEPSLRKLTKVAEKELNRLNHIVQQTLHLYPKIEPPVSVRITQLLDEILALYRHRLEGVTIKKRYADLEPIMAPENELMLLFSNIFLNAAEAMKGNGTLALRVYSSRDWRAGSVPGIRVVIADNGPGIRREHRGKIFEPFFTTKSDKGTGLGLWVARILAEKNGGTIRVRSNVGSLHHGTCFSVFLPLIASQSLKQRGAGSEEAA